MFGLLGRATVWLGPAGHGTRAKLVLNNWLADLTETTAETLSFARRLGLDPAEIVDLLQSNPLGAPYAVQKARVMPAGDFSPAFALKHGLKDAELAAQAAHATGATLTLTSALLPRWRDTAASGARRRRPRRGLPCPAVNIRVLADSFGGTSTTCSPAATSQEARCLPTPLLPSTAQVRAGH